MWDVAIVGAGPAGSAAALGALHANPAAKVLLLDRAGFPRDKACGDGIAPHVLDVLAGVGLSGLLSDCAPVRRLQMTQGVQSVERTMARPAYVVPRALFDSRLVHAAIAAGAVLEQCRVRSARPQRDCVVLDDTVRARVVIGADGAYSSMRNSLGLSLPRRRALALRGYAPTPEHRRGRQVIVFGRGQQPAYAWSFDRGDGLANVGYGELLAKRRASPTRRHLLNSLDELLPGATADGANWLGHHLPLSSWRWDQPDGNVLLVGDAAGLINPLTGEGIYYAVATGAAAGRAAVWAATVSGEALSAGAAYRTEVRSLLARHLRSTATASRLVSLPRVPAAAVRAAARDQRVFDDLVEVGLGAGKLTSRAIRGIARGLR